MSTPSTKNATKTDHQHSTLLVPQTKVSPTAVTNPFHESPPPRIPLFTMNSTTPSFGHASQYIRHVWIRQCKRGDAHGRGPAKARENRMGSGSTGRANCTVRLACHRRYIAHRRPPHAPAKTTQSLLFSTKTLRVYIIRTIITHSSHEPLTPPSYLPNPRLGDTPGVFFLWAGPGCVGYARGVQQY